MRKALKQDLLLMGHGLDAYIRKQICLQQTIQNEFVFHVGRVEFTCIKLVQTYVPIALFLTNSFQRIFCWSCLQLYVDADGKPLH